MALVPSTSVGGASTATELDYVEITGNVNVTGTTDATANAIITGTSLGYTGSRIRFEAFVPLAAIKHTAAVALIFNLYDGATDLGEIGQVADPTNINADFGAALTMVRYFTPSVATHQYILKAWKTNGTGTIYANTGGVATILPAYIRVSLA